MASIYKEIFLDADPADVWAAISDVGAAHIRLVPGVLVDARLDGDARIVTFAHGMVARERIVTLDHDVRRFVYASVGGRAVHHNASFQVFSMASTAHAWSGSPTFCRTHWSNPSAKTWSWAPRP